MEDIFSTFGPIFAWTRLLGFAPYAIEGPPKNRYLKYTFIYDLISNLAHMSYIACSIYSYSKVPGFMDQKSTMAFIALVIFISSATLSALIIVLFNKVYNVKTMSIFTDLYEIERKLKTMGIVMDYGYMRRLSVLMISSHLVFIFDSCLYATFSVNDNYWVSISIVAVSSYMTILQIMTSVQFWIMFTVLRNAFSKLNRFASSVIGTNRPENVGKLRDIASSHANLCEISRNCNEIFSAKILFIFWFYFTMTTLQTYIVVSTLINYGRVDVQVVWSSIMALIYLGLFAIFVLVSSRCTYEVGRTKDILYKMASGSEDALLNREINAFSLQILHEEFAITAGGFFTIDFSLLTSIVSALSTYLVILVQYDPKASITDNFYPKL